MSEEKKAAQPAQAKDKLPEDKKDEKQDVSGGDIEMVDTGKDGEDDKKDDGAKEKEDPEVSAIAGKFPAMSQDWRFGELMHCLSELQKSSRTSLF